MAADWSEVLLGARLADVREDVYRDTLTLAALVELLVEKGLLSRIELAAKARELDTVELPRQHLEAD